MRPISDAFELHQKRNQLLFLLISKAVVNPFHSEISTPTAFLNLGDEIGFHMLVALQPIEFIGGMFGISFQFLFYTVS